MIDWHKIFHTLGKLAVITATIVLLGACTKEPDQLSSGTIDVSDQSCLSCNILTDIYDAVGSQVGVMYGHFTSAAMPVMMVAFSVWLALRLLKFVSSVTESNAGEVWNEIIRKAFVCVLCGTLASSSGMLLYVINSLVFPVYSAFLKLGVDILNTSFTSSLEEGFVVFGTQIDVKGVNMNCSIEGTILSSAGEFPNSLKNTMRCMIQLVSTYLTIGGDIAIEVMNQGGLNLTSKIMGIILYLFFWVVKIGFSFYLVDTIFQMGIIIMLLPLYIVSYAFGPTREWTKKGFVHILASSAFMMCFSVIISLVLVAMVSLIQNNPSIFNPEDLQANMKDISIGFLCLLLIGFLIYGSMGVSQQITSSLLGVGMSANFQKNLKAMVKGIGGAILSGLGSLVTFGLSMAPQSSIKFIQGLGKAYESSSAFKAKMARIAGRK